MTDIARLAAGVLCMGFDGHTLSREMEARLHSQSIAGVVLFARNIRSLEQTRELTDRIRAVCSDAVIAIDQEGGRVARLRDRVEELPSMMALAAADDADLARRAGEQMGFDLRRAGVNVDFAPVLDLALFDQNTVIGARSFGDDPERVAALAGAFAQGLQAQGIVPTFKHFPGHGRTHVDSHLDLPAIDAGIDVLRDADLIPFARLLGSAQAVMTAHIIVRALDPLRPATISPPILQTLLRDELRFRGVCFTDCMEMAAIRDRIGSAKGAVQAIVAGADCVLVSHTAQVADESIDAIVRAAESGDLPLARLTQAHSRVAALRSRLHGPIALDEKSPHPGVGVEIGRRAVTVLKGCPDVTAAQSMVISFEGTTTEGVQGVHTDHAALPAPPQVPQWRLPLDPQPELVAESIARMRGEGKRPIVLMRRAHVYRGQQQAVREILRAFPDAVVVSLREPFDALAIGDAQTVLCTYGDEAPSLAGLAGVLFGGAPAPGRLPLRRDAAAV